MIKLTQKILILSLFLFFGNLYAQRIGEIVPDTAQVIFPPVQVGGEFIFSENGFGAGFFYEHNFTNLTRGFVNFSISEQKSENEFERYDYWGRPYTIGKVNRVYGMPLIFGLTRRLFSEVLTDNFRPFISGGIGPSVTVTTPYNREFFSSLKYARAYPTGGAFIAFGANIGVSRTKLLGLELRYEYQHIFGSGVETLYQVYKKDFGTFMIILKVGGFY